MQGLGSEDGSASSSTNDCSSMAEPCCATADTTLLGTAGEQLLGEATANSTRIAGHQLLTHPLALAVMQHYPGYTRQDRLLHCRHAR